ncbi:MAG: hypothetical protein GY831_26520, partial [Delftia sp.]|nr:hypothetical protein [Delftia sp.]
TAAQFCTALGLLISAPFSANLLSRGYPLPCEQVTAWAFILLQSLAVLFYAASARILRWRGFAHVATWLSFFPVTLFFVNYGTALFGQALTAPQYGIVWAVLGLIYLLAGAMLDRNKVRYAHGPYLGGYVLITFAVPWTLGERSALLWSLGLGIIAAVWSALMIHFDHHRTWNDLLNALFGQKQSTARSVTRS